MEAIASRLEVIAIGLEAIASRLQGIGIGLEAIANRLEAIAIRIELPCKSLLWSWCILSKSSRRDGFSSDLTLSWTVFFKQFTVGVLSYQKRADPDSHGCAVCPFFTALSGPSSGLCVLLFAGLVRVHVFASSFVRVCVGI